MTSPASSVSCRPLPALAVAGLLSLAGLAHAQSSGYWKMTWADEFNGTALDNSKWFAQDVAWPYNAELQYYSPDQVAVNNGQLTITSLRRTIGGRQYSSGRVESAGRFAQKYGRFEYRAKLPATQSIWPAFWLLPASNQWPPEIDIMELLGHQPTKIYGTHHWGTAAAPQNRGGSYIGADYSQGFHIFAVEWWPDRIDWFVDGVKYYTSTTNIPQEPMFLIINTAVGGNWPGFPNASTVFPQFHVVDYVRVYEWRPGNVLDNPAFETEGPGGPGGDFQGWTDFGNAFTTQIQPRSGLMSAKAFGNFNGVPNNASGFYQDRPITPGRSVTASVWAMHRAADAMVPGNQARLNLEWFSSTNAQLRVDSALALDSTAPRDVYRRTQLTAVAPAGAARVRISLLHIQGGSGPGAVQFDDASIVTNQECYANCDDSTEPPQLNALDFACFLTRFIQTQAQPAPDQIASYPNCDASTVPPVLNALDFSCFLTAFRAECP